MRIDSKKYKCFSLIEMVIVVAIISIMSAIVFASLKSNKSATNLKNAQREVAAVIKLAQSYTLQGRMEMIGGALVAPCGYGFRFIDNNNYQIYYNPGPACTKKNTRQSPYGTDYVHYRASDPDKSVVAESGSLKERVTLSSPATNLTEIYFTTPTADMFDYNGSTFSGQTLTFSYPSQTSVTKSITINTKGSITEQ